MLKLICITLCWLWFRSLFEIGICYLFGGFACEDLISRVLFNDSSWCAFDVLHGIRFVWGVISSFHPILVHLKWYCKIHFFQFLVLHLERKEKNIYGFTLMYAHGTQMFYFYFSFLSHFCLFAFRCFSSCWKIRPASRPTVFILYSSASSNLDLLFCFSLSHWKSIVYKYTRAKQFQFFFFSLSLKLFFFLVPAKP